MTVGEVLDFKSLTENHRVFLKETKLTWWQRLLGRKPEVEILIFDKGSHLDFPLQVEFLRPPEGLTSRERFFWRQQHGLSTVCYNAKQIMDAEMDAEAEREGS
jgi:hypothetical protein